MVSHDNTAQTSSGRLLPPVELSIIVPMYNEADNIENMVFKIRETLAGFNKSWELILVDDGSSDNTLGIARELEERIENFREDCGIRIHLLGLLPWLSNVLGV